MKALFSRGNTFSSIQEIAEFQEGALNELLLYLNQYSPFYKQLFSESSVDASKPIRLTDLAKIPFTTKEDLQFRTSDFLCVDRTEVLEYVTTTGTTGQPVTIALTENDIKRLAYNEYISFQRLGLTKSDSILLAVTSDRCFMAGMAYAYGARELGAAIIRTGPGLPELQWETIHRIQPTVMVAVPSFILKMIDYAEKNGIDFRSCSIKKVLCIGESLRDESLKDNELAKRIIEKWPLKLFSTYASTEMATAFTECVAGKGGHLNPELLIVETVDEHGKPTEEGMPGEVVITTLGIEGMPLLRFRTGDIAILHKENCKCGDLSLRIGPILGRNKQMIKYKGTTIYPPAIKEIMHMLGVDSQHFAIATLDELGLDKLTIFIPTQWKENIKMLKDSFRSRLRIVPDFQFVSEKEIELARNQQGLRKPIEFLDKRGVNDKTFSF